MYNPVAFKSHLSPQLLLEAISKESDNTFVQGIRSDPFAFLRWFLLYLKNDPSLRKRDGDGTPSTIIDTCCRGMVRIQQSTKNDTPIISYIPSLFLSLPLPSAPIFPDVVQKQIQVPEVTIHSLLQRFNGSTKILNPDGTYRYLKLVKLPPYLLIHIARFTRTEFFIEKNPTHVRFPLRGLNMKEWIVNN
uniref:Putative mRNA-splicing protein ubp10 n=1 Tax=Lygus hesperus TaxID=30085 RepID=A0A0A9YPE9_LYGHE